MKKYVKIILAALAVILVVAVAVRVIDKKKDAKEIISLVVTNKEKISELVTYRYSRDTVLFETGVSPNLINYLAGKTDTVAVFIARPTICAGVDLSKLREEDLSIKGDTLYVNLPAPEILDLYLNHSDIKQVYSARTWNLDNKMGSIAERAKEGLRRDALRQGILAKAGSRAERTLSDFLSQLCRMPVVVSTSQPTLVSPIPPSS